MAEPHARVMTATPPLPCGRCGHNSLRLVVLVGPGGESVGHQLLCSACDPAGMAGMVVRRAPRPVPGAAHRARAS